MSLTYLPTNIYAASYMYILSILILINEIIINNKQNIYVMYVYKYSRSLINGGINKYLYKHVYSRRKPLFLNFLWVSEFCEF